MVDAPKLADAAVIRVLLPREHAKGTSSYALGSIFRHDGNPTQYPHRSRAIIICGWCGGNPRSSRS